MEEERFNHIKSAYDRYVQELLGQGRLPMRSTAKGFWSHALSDEVFAALKRVAKPHHRFLDIGSGDGRVVLLASLLCSKAEGVECDQELHDHAVAMQRKLGINNASFHLKDFYKHDLSAYDLLFINPDAPFHRGVEDKLLAEMKGSLLVHGPHFEPRYLRQVDRLEVNGTPFTVWEKHSRKNS